MNENEFYKEHKELYENCNKELKQIKKLMTLFNLGARVKFFCFSVFWLCPYGSLWFLSVEERIERWTNNLKSLELNR